MTNLPILSGIPQITMGQAPLSIHSPAAFNNNRITLRAVDYSENTRKYYVNLYHKTLDFDSMEEAQIFLSNNSIEINKYFHYLNVAYAKITALYQLNLSELTNKQIRTFNETKSLIDQKITFLTSYNGKVNHFFYKGLDYLTEKLLFIIAIAPKTNNEIQAVEKVLRSFLKWLNINRGIEPEQKKIEAAVIKPRKKRMKYRKAKRTNEKYIKAPVIILQPKEEKIYSPEIESFISYLKTRQRSVNTIISYKRVICLLESFLKEKFNKSILDADKLSMREFLVCLYDKKLNTRSINSYIYALKLFYKHCMRIGLLKGTPCKDMTQLKFKRKSIEFLQSDTIINTMDQIEIDNKYVFRDRIVLELLYGTGMRMSELINLKIRNLFFEENILKVLGKGNKERIIFIPKGVTTLLREFFNIWIHKTEFVIETNDHQKSYEMLIARITQYYLKCSPHKLRHSFATMLLNNGANLKQISTALGHSGLGATQVYTHVSTKRIKESFDSAHPKA